MITFRTRRRLRALEATLAEHDKLLEDLDGRLAHLGWRVGDMKGEVHSIAPRIRSAGDQAALAVRGEVDAIAELVERLPHVAAAERLDAVEARVDRIVLALRAGLNLDPEPPERTP